MISPGTPTIDAVLTEFLAEQRDRLSARTFARYEDVIRLLRSSLDNYGPNSLDRDERHRWERAFESDDEAFCHLFGPEKIPEHLGEFLGYFMIRKVFASQELLKASGTVTKKLVRWLHSHGYIDRELTGDAVERAQDAARDLPVARVEPGQIWFEGGVGPIAVPRAASDMAQPGWSLFVTAARDGGRWHLLEVGFVYP